VTLTIPEIGKEVERVVLPGGTTVFLREDHSAPSVDMAMVWLGGKNIAPLDQLARYELASDLVDEGGTEALGPIALQERKEGLGMSFSVSIGATQSSASFWSLRRNFDEAFAVALDVLQKPRLDPSGSRSSKGSTSRG